MGKSCFFIGNQDAPDRIMDVLEATVETHVTEDGVTDFYVGNYGNFDRMAASVVIRIKQVYPQVRLILVRPYLPHEGKNKLPEGFDDSIYPEGLEFVPERFAIIKANQDIINRIDHLIVYDYHGTGNTRKLIDYAKTRELRGELHMENLYNMAQDLQKPWNLVPEKTVLLTSFDENVIPEHRVVLLQLAKLIIDGFTVLIADVTTPFGQLAMEILPKIKQQTDTCIVCICAGKPVQERKNARTVYGTTDGYIRLCVMADCTYFYDDYNKVLSSAGYVCTESGVCTV